MVTGCSTGIGRATAAVLRTAGWHVIPTARAPADLESLREDGFAPIALDLADSTSVVDAAAEAIRRVDGQLGALVNNAGYGQVGALEDVSRDALRRQFEVNVFGMQELANCLLPHFRRAGAGRIVNVSSVYGFLTAPLLGSYCASKHAMESLSDALRMELRSAGIAVSLIEPGPIATAFRNNAATQAERSLEVARSRFGEVYRRAIERRKHRAKRPDFFTRPPEAVARKIRHALESPRPRRRYLVTIPAYVGAVGRRFLPFAVIDSLMRTQLPRTPRE
ncbi:MAG: SDR family NAD(P)-dependent oxidoreductase [Planctomycetes bacterium]|nr:SDR family NAD(P)-dependent oxidoreductase [Planctomycetota bacterium]